MGEIFMALRRRRALLAVSVVALVCAWAAWPRPTHAQPAPTIEQAHQFLLYSLGEGSGAFDMIEVNDDGVRWRRSTRRLQILRMESSGCTTTVYARGERGIETYRRIDWTTVRELQVGRDNIRVVGTALRRTVVSPPPSGAIDDVTLFSDVAATRVVAAAEVVRNHCNPQTTPF